MFVKGAVCKMLSVIIVKYWRFGWESHTGHQAKESLFDNPGMKLNNQLSYTLNTLHLKTVL